jgi:tetratricopeptide (TPR) repeat protein
VNTHPHKRNIAVVLILAALTFGNGLLNGFVGDDEFLFIKNPFFHSWANAPQLFSSDYITDQDAIFNDAVDKINSGSVAYRPVLSLTFFLDYGLWQQNPFGYHLQNVLLHLINSVLVYWLVFLVVKDPSVALVAALIFSVHPLKSEAVCSIGYRADSLAAFWVFLSLWMFLRAKEKGGASFLLSHLFFFLALFSKESVVFFPAALMAHDMLIGGAKPLEVLKGLGKRYVGFVLVLSFYLHIYFNVFPNSSLSGVRGLSTDLGVQIVTILRIFSHYLTVFVMPWTVKLLPPLYVPRIEALWGIKTWLAVGVVAAYGGILALAWKKDKRSAFFLLWFLLAFVPVSNIIVIANPMAYRFMYLPSFGLAAFAAVQLAYARKYLDRFSAKLYAILVVALVAVCMIATVFLNLNWRNNTMMALAMINDFPDYPVGYMHAGMIYFNAGMNDKAKELLIKSVELGLDDPRGLYVLGLATITDLKVSRGYFERCLREYPYFAHAHTGLGRIDLLEGRYDEALSYLNKSIQLSPNWKAYAYLMQLHTLHNDPAQTAQALEAGKAAVGSKDIESLEALDKIIKENSNSLPIDLGI